MDFSSNGVIHAPLVVLLVQTFPAMVVGWQASEQMPSVLLKSLANPTLSAPSSPPPLTHELEGYQCTFGVAVSGTMPIIVLRTPKYHVWEDAWGWGEGS